MDYKINIRKIIQELKNVTISENNYDLVNTIDNDLNELQEEIKRITKDFSKIIDKSQIMSKELSDAYKIIELSPVVIFRWTLAEDIPTHFVSENVKQYGHTPNDFYNGDLKDYWNFIYEDDRESAKKIVYDARKNKLNEFQHQYRIVQADGSISWVEEHTYIKYSEDGTPQTEEGILYDITKQKTMEENLIENETRYRNLFEKAPAIMMTLDLSGRITSLNQTGERLIGYNQSEWFNQPIQKFLVKKTYDKINLQSLKLLIEKSSKEPFELLIKCKDNTEHTLNISLSLLTKEKKPFEIQAIAHDITIQKLQDEKIRFLSFHDNLTKLYNRAYFDEKIKMIDMAKNYPYSVIIGDMNGLKETNDLLGHEAGDELLITMAEILRKSCRNSDIICRFGGDEFAIILPSTDNYGTEIICNRVREYCLQVDSKLLKPSIALGYSTKVSDDKKYGVIIKEADDTMYRNKLNISKSIRSSMILSLKTSLEEKTTETNNHAERIKITSLELGKRLMLTDSQLDELALAATMHDIGKIGIPDSILLKPEKLTDSEWEIMKKHCEIGFNILDAAPNMETVATYILYHHEKWDGTGYPKGLKGLDIPLISRILTIADSFDVMTHNREYCSAKTQSEAIEELQKCSNTQFDPEIVKVFIDMIYSGPNFEELIEISEII